MYETNIHPPSRGKARIKKIGYLNIYKKKSLDTRPPNASFLIPP